MKNDTFHGGVPTAPAAGGVPDAKTGAGLLPAARRSPPASY